MNQSKKIVVVIDHDNVSTLLFNRLCRHSNFDLAVKEFTSAEKALNYLKETPDEVCGIVVNEYLEQNFTTAVDFLTQLATLRPEAKEHTYLMHLQGNKDEQEYTDKLVKDFQLAGALEKPLMQHKLSQLNFFKGAHLA